MSRPVPAVPPSIDHWLPWESNHFGDYILSLYPDPTAPSFEVLYKLLVGREVPDVRRRADRSLGDDSTGRACAGCRSPLSPLLPSATGAGLLLCAGGAVRR